eukprot:gb/GFBE01066220.1/.p1 GENE.gb/GFBE01066220.1/~~gb/GFBE01066220.1/.p1  ORF type:complete len:239 (+),score=16.51 gb/GFBE01066220.1/:1-717(+)
MCTIPSVVKRSNAQRSRARMRARFLYRGLRCLQGPPGIVEDACHPDHHLQADVLYPWADVDYGSLCWTVESDEVKHPALHTASADFRSCGGPNDAQLVPRIPDVATPASTEGACLAEPFSQSTADSAVLPSFEVEPSPTDFDEGMAPTISPQSDACSQEDVKYHAERGRRGTLPPSLGYAASTMQEGAGWHPLDLLSIADVSALSACCSKTCDSDLVGPFLDRWMDDRFEALSKWPDS